MTAVGLLCKQYLGERSDSQVLGEGADYLMKHLPQTSGERDIYYWYYATQVLHHMLGDNWQRWNRAMRRVLIETQVTRKGCSAGSWDPDRPTHDRWGDYWVDGVGAEVFSVNRLQWLDQITQGHPDWREHPHLYFRDHGLGWLPKADIRLDVNTQADFDFLRDIYDHFGHHRFTTEDVVTYLVTKGVRTHG